MGKLKDTTVFIVEDEPMVIQALSERLLFYGFSAANIAHSDKAGVALKKIQQDRPDLIFVDFHLTEGDGAVMLIDLHEYRQKNNPYDPFIVAISSGMSPLVKNSVAPYSHAQFSKFEENYLDLALKRFLMASGVSFEGDVPPVVDSTQASFSSFIAKELNAFNFSALNAKQQTYVTAFVARLILELDNVQAVPRFTPLYKEIAQRYGVQSPSTVKTAIGRAFKETFLLAPHFHLAYTLQGAKPKQKEFYLHIAEQVKRLL